MPRFTVLAPIEHDGKRYRTGQSISLTEDQAEELSPYKVIGSAGAAATPAAPDADPTPLPEDFPARQALEAAGRATVESLAGLTVENLTAVKGVGEATAKQILAARDALTV